MSSQSIHQQQIPLCKVCNLQPAPQSTQNMALVILQILSAFINIKLTVVFIMIGYSFPRTVWKCPFCKRTVQQVKQNPGIQQNVIIRLGNCMALLSKTKVRVIASVIIGLMVYLYTQQPIHRPNVAIQTTWKSLLKNCGYQQYIDNSFKSNYLYSLYTESKQYWEIQGIYLQRKATGISSYENLYLKMNPTQFQNPDFYDVTVFTKLATSIQLQRGDIVLLKGAWEGRSYHHFIFIPSEVIKTGKKLKPQQAQYFYKESSMLRPHIEQVIKQEQKLIMQEIKIIQKDSKHLEEEVRAKQ